MDYDFNPSIDLLKESPTRKIDKLKEKLVSEGKDIILLSTGQPSIPPPKWAREKLAEKLMENTMKLYRYTPSDGRKSTKEAIIRELERHGVQITHDQLTLTAGGQSALFSTIITLFKPGDKAVVFDPMYFGYWPLLDYAGVKPIVLKEELEEGFQPPIEKLKEAISKEKIKAVILVSPDNPTGRIIEYETAKAITDLAKDHGFLIITDEAYRTLVYEGEHTYLYPLAPDNVVSVNAFSKDPGIPGWRLGFVYGPEEIVKKIKLVVSETVYCPPIIAQELVEIYLNDLEKADEFIKRVRETYSSKRDVLIRGIQEHIPDGRFVKPKGGMFVFLDLEKYLGDKGIGSEEFAKLLLEKKHVAVVPGTYFSRYYNYSIRLSFVTETNDRMVEGIKRIAELLSNL